MLRARPAWLFWFLWFVAYFILDAAFSLIVHHAFTWANVPGATKDAAVGATITWALALYRWYKADSAT